MILDAPTSIQDLSLRDTLTTELGTIQIYNNLIVMEAKEDALLSIRTGLFILLKVIQIVGTRPVVYISNRVNSYSVDPNDYKYLEMIPTLKGIAVVKHDPVGIGAIELERWFYNKPFSVFESMEDAVSWAQEILEPGNK